MLGFGLTNYIPSVIYCLGIAVAILVIFYRLEIGILFLVFLLPLQNVLVRLHSFPFGKDFVDILLIAMVIGWLIRSIVKKEKFLEKTPFNLLLLLLILITYIGLWRGSSYLGFPAPISASDIRVQTWKNYMILPLIFFITVNNVKNLKQIKWLVLFMVLSMFLMDYYTGNQIRWMSGLASRDKLNGTFVWLGPNEIAAFYATYTFVLLGIFLFDKVKIRRILFGTAILLNLYCALFLYSRGAYVAILAGLVLICLVKNKKLLIPLIFLLFFWQAIIPASVVERIKMTRTEEGVLESSTADRLDLWKKSIELFKENPIVGVGFSVFPYLGYEKGDPHNIYMEVLLEQGIIGITIFLLLLYLALKYSWRLYKTTDDRFLKGLGLGFTACVIATMTTNIFGDRWTYLQLGAYYWVFLALVVRGNIIVQEQSQTKAIA